MHYVNFCLAFSPGQFFALGPWLVHYFFMSPFPTFLDGPYRPKAQPRSGIFHPLTKVLFTTAVIGVIGGLTAVVVLL